MPVPRFGSVSADLQALAAGWNESKDVVEFTYMLRFPVARQSGPSSQGDASAAAGPGVPVESNLRQRYDETRTSNEPAISGTAVLSGSIAKSAHPFHRGAAVCLVCSIGIGVLLLAAPFKDPDADAPDVGN